MLAPRRIQRANGSAYVRVNMQRWAQIRQNVFKIQIQNTVWENVFKYKYSILYFENTQNTFEIGHAVK